MASEKFDRKVSGSVTVVEHIMTLRRLSPAFKGLYPASWKMDLSHFVGMMAEIGGVESSDYNDFIQKVTAGVNEIAGVKS